MLGGTLQYSHVHSHTARQISESQSNNRTHTTNAHLTHTHVSQKTEEKGGRKHKQPARFLDQSSLPKNKKKYFITKKKAVNLQKKQTTNGSLKELQYKEFKPPRAYRTTWLATIFLFIFHSPSPSSRILHSSYIPHPHFPSHFPSPRELSNMINDGILEPPQPHILLRPHMEALPP